MKNYFLGTLSLLLFILLSTSLLADEPLAARVKQLTKEVTPQVVQWRRSLHSHPELSNREVRTSKMVAEELRKLGVDELKTEVAHHGVVALIRGTQQEPVVALRADMDALPILEDTGLPFASCNKGVMHACGHDAHTAILLGAARVLVQMRDKLPGTVKLIFQPAEEGQPAGEEGGARLMIKEGVLLDPKVSAIFGLHVNPSLEAGKISYRAGGLLASVDRFKVTVTGKQSHAAMPWQGVDPIVATAHIVAAVQTIASRKIDARKPVVVSFGIVEGGQAWNIIPGKVILEGTIRTHDNEVRKTAVEQFKHIVLHTAEAHGAKAIIDMQDYGPVTWNDPDLVQAILPTLIRAAGKQSVVEAEPIMPGEDFAHYAQKIPGCFVFLGVQNEKKGAVHPLHNSKFLLDEDALPLGVQTMALFALDYLRLQAK